MESKVLKVLQFQKHMVREVEQVYRLQTRVFSLKRLQSLQFADLDHQLLKQILHLLLGKVLSQQVVVAER